MEINFFFSQGDFYGHLLAWLRLEQLVGHQQAIFLEPKPTTLAFLARLSRFNRGQVLPNHRAMRCDNWPCRPHRGLAMLGHFTCFEHSIFCPLFASTFGSVAADSETFDIPSRLYLPYQEWLRSLAYTLRGRLAMTECVLCVHCHCTGLNNIGTRDQGPNRLFRIDAG